MRTDAAIARLSELVCIAAGIKNKFGQPLTFAELMPFTDGDDGDRVATEEDMKRMFGIQG